MKKKAKTPDRSTVLLPTELKVEFRKVCIVQDLKPAEILSKIVAAWIEKEKKKTNLALVSNG